MAKRKKKKQDKTLKRIGVGFGVAGGLLLGWYGVNRYKIWLDSRKLISSTKPITGGSNTGSTGGIPVSNAVICKGDKGSKVRILQSYLKHVKGQNLGAYGVDGDWGNDTQKAVENVFGIGVTCFSQEQVDAMLDAYQ